MVSKATKKTIKTVDNSLIIQIPLNNCYYKYEVRKLWKYQKAVNVYRR